MVDRRRPLQAALGGALALLSPQGAPALPPASAPVEAGVGVWSASGARLDQLSLARGWPLELAPSFVTEREPGVRWVVWTSPSRSVTSLRVRSLGPHGEPLAERALPLRPGACPEGVPARVACWRSSVQRLVMDEVDAQHPAAQGSSLLAEVGGQVVVSAGAGPVGSWRVGAPRELGGRGFLAARLRVAVVRISEQGSPAVGEEATDAVQRARAAVRAASLVWGQCGVTLEVEQVEVVAPPPPRFLTVGCGAGLPARGGRVRWRLGGRPLEVRVEPGDSPERAARRIGRAIERSGARARYAWNVRAESAALPSVDVSAVDSRGRTLELAADGAAPLSQDAALCVQLGSVDLTDGLSHFSNDDAALGTVEERALLSAFDDGDPSTIEVLVVPSFAGASRIGESFLAREGAGRFNAVIVDRIGLRASVRSYTLAHELGHVLLNLPRHPDDYGVDTTSQLMDADAADASIFGPRRLTLADCRRALTESGPDAFVPLLRWVEAPPSLTAAAVAP